MKYIKTLLAITTIALLGSYARATSYEYTVEVGETLHVSDVLKYYDSQKQEYKDRWWCVKDGDSEIGTVIFDRKDGDPNQDELAITGTHSNAATFSVHGVAPNTTTWTVYTYTDAGQAADNTYPTLAAANKGANGKTYGSNAWSNGSGHTIKITVVEPQWTVEKPVFTTATSITFAEGATKGAAKYEGFLTKKGYKYTWGDEDDKPLDNADWREGDGTPMKWAKPDGAKNLLVREAK